MSKLRAAILTLSVAAITALGVNAASSEGRKNQPTAKTDQPAAPAGASNVMAPTAEVDGFRSAKFGMNEAETKTAIIKDFKVKTEDIREQPNPGERTKALLVKVPDVLPGGGVGEVSYVFGYQSKKLIQVSVSWSKGTDDKMTPEQLFSNSSVLRSHFLGEGFKPDSIATNMPINGGVLMFRGSDAHDRTAMMMLQGTFAQGDNNQRVLTPTALLLFYIADAKTPDIYKLPAGSF
jgi:hypothetical protein